MAVINKEIAYMALPLSIRRGNPFPIDEYSVWYDAGEMNTYAQTSPVAYVGQVLTLVNEEESTVEAYVIQNAAGTLTKLAATTASGDLTEDVQTLQGQVTNLVSLVGTKAEDSSLTSANVWAALDEIDKAYKSALGNYYNKTETDEKINAALTSAYKAAGSVEFASLPTAANTEEGKVYNISNAFTTDENFVEGAGKGYPAGTNVVCVEVEEGTYKWDAISGFVDLSDYATNAALENKVDKVEGSALVEQTLIDKLNGLANIKSTTAELEVSEEGALGVKAINSSKVTGLDTSLATKVDKESGKSLVEDTLISKLTNLAEINSVSGEFTLDSNELSVNAIDQSKVTGLPAALEAKLSGVTIGDTPAVPAEGVVTIPVATADAYGVVKSNAGENAVAVDNAGVMTVNSLNVNKLVQTEGETLTLNGGTSAL